MGKKAVHKGGSNSNVCNEAFLLPIKATEKMLEGNKTRFISYSFRIYYLKVGLIQHQWVRFVLKKKHIFNECLTMFDTKGY